MKNFLYIFILFVVLIACQKDEDAIREFPRLMTHEVSDITTNGAKFNADLISQGSSPIIEYGFVWGTRDNPSIEHSEIVSQKGQPTEATFSMLAEHALKEGETYYVKAFAKNDDYITYGDVISFLSLGSKAPVITDFEPKTGIVGDTIYITGKYFTKNKFDLKLKFNDHEASIYVSSDSSMKARVPQLTEIENEIKITIYNNEVIADKNFRLQVPEILSFSPKEGIIGVTITVQGNNFLIDNIEEKIMVGSAKAEVLYVSENEIQLEVPKINLVLPHPSLPNNEVLQHKIKILNDIKVVESEDHFMYLFPEIIEINPPNGSSGDTLYISGNKFTSLGYDQKLFFGSIEIDPIYIDDNLIKLIVPGSLGVIESAFISLKIDNAIIYSNELYNVNNPNNGGSQVLLPNEATFGDIVIFYLEDIDGSTNDISVALTDVDAEITEIGVGYVKFRIPDENLYVNEMITIRIRTSYQTFDGILSIKQPEIIDVIPSIVSYGDTVTLVGRGFSPSTNYCWINIQGENVSVIEANYYQVSFTFPSGVQEVDGKISIQYFANALSSNRFTDVTLK